VVEGITFKMECAEHLRQLEKVEGSGCYKLEMVEGITFKWNVLNT